MKIDKSKAVNFGKSKGFNSVFFHSKFKGDSVFIAENEGEMFCTGYPVFILLNAEGARLANSEETLSIVGIVPISSSEGSVL